MAGSGAGHPRPAAPLTAGPSDGLDASSAHPGSMDRAAGTPDLTGLSFPDSRAPTRRQDEIAGDRPGEAIAGAGERRLVDSALS